MQKLTSALLVSFLTAFLTAVFWLVMAREPLPQAQNRFSLRNGEMMPRVGLQLYSVRRELQKDVPGTLAKVRQMGFRTVEGGGGYGLTTAQFRAELDKAGLKCAGTGADFNKLKTDTDSVIRDAKTMGAEYVMCAWIPHKDKFTLDDARQAAQVFNAAGEKLRAAGLGLMYHIHGYEFQPHENGTLFDVLMAETKPGLVDIEMDVFWVIHPGQDPVALLKKYGKRVRALHIKDKQKGVAGDLTGKAPDSTNVVAGTGQVKWPAVLRAAGNAGVKYYLIEDEAEAAVEQIPRSLEYLRNVRY
ncbi:MAG: sugar phosphate isomerase/epimerase family protein [Blastocatellia bacterium]